MTDQQPTRCRTCGSSTITVWRVYDLRETRTLEVPCQCFAGDVSTLERIEEVRVEEYIEIEDDLVVTRDPNRFPGAVQDEREVGCETCFARAVEDPDTELDLVETEGPFNEEWTIECARCKPRSATA